jgi:glycosyltransferase involved in cell wall biosynthesis
LIKGLFRRGHEIHLISFSRDYPPPKLVVEVLNKYCKSMRFLQLDDDLRSLTRNLITNLHRKDVLLFRYKSADLTKRLLLKTVVEKDIDLVHFDIVSMTQHIVSVDGLVPTVASINDSYSLWLKEKLLSMRAPYAAWNSILDKMYYTIMFPIAAAYEKNAYERFQKVHVVSEIDGVYLKNLNSEIDVEVIPNGVDTEYFKQLGLPLDEKSLAFTAHMTGENASSAIWFIRKVFPKVRKKVPDLKLYLVGKSPDPILQSEARKNRNIIVTGYVADVRPWIDKAALVIDPRSKRCGILNNVLESMAMGKTVVGTRSSFLAIRGAKSWRNAVIARNEKDFASKIAYLLENEDERKTIGGNARQLVSMWYSWERIISCYEKMYSDANKKLERIRGH